MTKGTGKVANQAPDTTGTVDADYRLDVLEPRVDSVLDGTALDGRYEPVVDGFYVLAGTAHKTPTGNAAASTIAAGAPCWLMDASTNEQVAFSFRLPSSWSTFSIKAVWANAGAGTGDIRSRCYTKSYGAGEILTGSTASTTATTTAAAQSTEFRTTLESSLSANDETWIVVVERVGTDGADTLANDVALLGLLVEKVT